MPGRRSTLEEHSKDVDTSMTENARRAADREKDISIKEAFKTNRGGILWSLLFLSAVIMEGFDLALLSGFYGFPAFKNSFGEEIKKGDGIVEMAIPAKWETMLSAGAQIGQIIGLSIAGVVAQRIGYKRTMILALSFMTCFIFIPVFAQDKNTLFVGEIVQGIPWGVFETMPAAYAVEIAPLALRPYLTTWANMCWVLGQLLAVAVLRGCLVMDANNSMTWRIPFMLQWAWPIPILIGVLMAPESPWWLIRQGQDEKARRSIQKSCNYGEEATTAQLQLIKHTVSMEKKNEHSEKSGQSWWAKAKRTLSTYGECFRGIDRRRTEITCGTWISQSLCGSNLMLAFAVLFFKAAGLEEEQSFTLGLGGLALGAVGTIMSWVLMNYAGRRTIYVWGLSLLFIILLVIGFLGFITAENNTARWAAAYLVVLYIAVYDLTVGPCCYAIVNEIPSAKLRAATVALARICYNLCGIFSVIVNPLMLHRQDWNWGAKSALFWACLCFACAFWAFWRLPEPKGRNFGELDVLFNDKVNARKFKKTKVDQFSTKAGKDVFCKKDTDSSEPSETHLEADPQHTR